MSFDFAKHEKQTKDRQVLTRKLKNLPDSYIADILKVLGLVGKRSDIFQTCITCRYWNDDKQLCNKFNILPPAKVIVDSCSCYEDKFEVPF